MCDSEMVSISKQHHFDNKSLYINKGSYYTTQSIQHAMTSLVMVSIRHNNSLLISSYYHQIQFTSSLLFTIASD